MKHLSFLVIFLILCTSGSFNQAVACSGGAFVKSTSEVGSIGETRSKVLGTITEFLDRLFPSRDSSLTSDFGQNAIEPNSGLYTSAESYLNELLNALDRTPYEPSRLGDYRLVNPNQYAPFKVRGLSWWRMSNYERIWKESVGNPQVSVRTQYVHLLLSLAVLRPSKRYQMATQLLNKWVEAGNPFPRMMFLPILQLIPTEISLRNERWRVKLYKEFFDQTEWATQETLWDYALYLSLIPDSWQAEMIKWTLSKERRLNAPKDGSIMAEYRQRSQELGHLNPYRLEQVIARLLRSNTDAYRVIRDWTHYTRARLVVSPVEGPGESVVTLNYSEDRVPLPNGTENPPVIQLRIEAGFSDPYTRNPAYRDMEYYRDLQPIGNAIFFQAIRIGEIWP